MSYQIIGFTTIILLAVSYILIKYFQLQNAVSQSSLRKPVDTTKYDDL